MVDSTETTARFIHPDKIGKYYWIFLNAMAAIAKNFGAKVIKNVGDGLLFHFPFSLAANNKTIFEEVLECFAAIIAARELINTRISGTAS
jgi:two-component system, OmpR family, response regulator ChvI